MAPVREERDDRDLEVEGELPAGLRGMFVRTGPNPQFAPLGAYHPFDGDGMLHAVYFVDGKARYHVNEQDFVPASLYGSAGARYTKGDNQFSFGLTQFTYYINQYHNDDQTGAFVQWQREFTPQDMGGAFAQYVRVDHPIARNLNTDLFMVGGFWNHAFQREGNPMLSLVAYAGDDRQLGDDPTVGRQLYGAKAGLDYHLNERTKIYGSFGTQYSRYGGTNLWFMTKREDTRYDLSLGVAYKPTREWTVTPQLLHTKNDSTVGFNDWARTQALVTVRRDFY
jgi:opacity protein-like surface antigen